MSDAVGAPSGAIASRPRPYSRSSSAVVLALVLLPAGLVFNAEESQIFHTPFAVSHLQSVVFVEPDAPTSPLRRANEFSANAICRINAGVAFRAP